MFRKLKTQITDTVTEKLKQASDNLTPKDNQSVRSRKSSFSSIASESNTSTILSNYSSPQKQYYPPSDIESEADFELKHQQRHDIGDNGVDGSVSVDVKKLHKIIETYKNKFHQLKNAYTECENEKEKIKTILTQNQDKALRRIHDLRDQIDLDKKAKIEREQMYQKLLDDKEKQLTELKLANAFQFQQQLDQQHHERLKSASSDVSNDPIINDLNESNEKIKHLKILMVKYKEIMKTQQEQLKNLTEENQSLKNTVVTAPPVSQTTADPHTFEKRIQDLNSEIHEKDAFYKDQINFIQTEYTAEKVKLSQLNVELNEQIAGLKQNLNENEANLSQLNLTYKNLFQNYEKIETEKLELIGKLARLENLMECQPQADGLSDESENEYKAIIERLENEITELNTRLEGKQKQLEKYEDDMKVNLDRIQGTYASMNVEMQDKDGEIKKLEKCVLDFKAQMQAWERELDETRKEAEANQAEKMRLAKELDQKDGVLKETETRVLALELDLTGKLGELQNAAINFEKAEALFKSEITEREDEIKRLNVNAGDLHGKIKELDGLFEEKLNELENYESKLSDAENDKLELQQKLQKLAYDLDENVKELANYKEKSRKNLENLENTFETELSAKEAELKRLKTDKLELNEKVQRLENIIEIQTKQNHDEIETVYKTEIIQKRNEITGLEKQIDNLENDKFELNTKIQKLESVLEELYKKVKACEEMQIEKLEHLEETYKNELAYKQTQIKRLELETVELNGRVLRLEDDVDERNKEILCQKEEMNGINENYDRREREHNQLEREKFELESKVQELEDELKRVHDDQVARLQAKEDELKTVQDKRLAQLEGKEAELSSAQEEHRNQLQTKENELKQLGDDVAKLNGKIQCLEGELVERNKEILSQNELKDRREREKLDLESRVQKLEEELICTNGEHSNQLEAKQNELRQALDDHRVQLQRLEEEQRQALTKAQDEHVQAKENELKELHREHSVQLQTKEEELKQVQDQLQLKTDELEEKLKEFRLLEDELRQALDKAQDEHVSKLQVKEDELREAHEEHRLQLEAKEEELTQVKSQLQLKIGELSAKSTEFKLLEEELRQSIGNVQDEHQLQFKAKEDELKQIQVNLNQKENELKQLKVDRVELSSKIEHLQNLLDAQSKQNTEQIENVYKIEIKSKEDDIAQLKQSIDKLKSESVELNRKFEVELDELARRGENEQKIKLNGIYEKVLSLTSSYFELNNGSSRDCVDECVFETRLEADYSKIKNNLLDLKLNSEKLSTDLELSIRKYSDLDCLYNSCLNANNENINERLNEIKNLNEKNDQLQKEVQNEKTHLEESKIELQKLNEQLKFGAEKHQDLERENQTLKSQIESMEETILKRTTELEAKILEIKQTLEKLTRVETALAATEQTNRQLNESHECMNGRIRQLEDDIVAKQRAIDELNVNLDGLRNALNDDKSALNTKLQTLNSELHEFTQRVDKEVEINKKLNDELTNRQLSIDKLNDEKHFYLNVFNLFEVKFKIKKMISDRDLNEIEKTIDSVFGKLSGEYEALKVENQELLNQIEVNAESASRRNGLLEQNKNKLNQYEAEINDLKSKLNEAEVKCKELETVRDTVTNDFRLKLSSAKKKMEKLKLTEEQLTNVTSEKASIETERNQIIEKFNRLSDQHGQIKELVDTLESKNQTLTSELNQCKNHLKLYENDNSNLVGQIKSLKHEIESQITIQSEQSDNAAHVEKQLTEQLNNLEFKYEQLRNALSEKEKCIQELDQKHVDKDNQIRTLKDTAIVESAKHDRLTSEKETLETELTSLNELYQKAKEREFLENKRQSEFDKHDVYATKTKLKNGSPVYRDYKSNRNVLDNSNSAILEMNDNENLLHSNYMTLESTEIDYLRQIIYAYMMGTDPITMAKVIVAVLKFSDDETKQIIEHEKSKQGGAWFSVSKLNLT